MKNSHPVGQPSLRRVAHLPLLAFALCGTAASFTECKGFSADSGSNGTSSGGASLSDGGSTSTAGGSGAESGGGEGEAPCPTIWKGCPPMDTALEPLHERVNGAGALLLAHGAFWLQGSVVFRNPDSSRGENFLGALRIPYEPGSTPRVLEGNVAIGEFVTYDGRVYHPDFGDNGLLAVYEPNGDLQHVLDVAQGDASAIPLQSPTFTDRTLILTTPNCRSLFFINIDDWSMERLDIEGEYLGGATSLTLVGDHLYCMGNGYIRKVDVIAKSVLMSWTDPLVADNLQGLGYSLLWDTPQGLVTWVNVGHNSSLFQTVDPATLAFSDYFASDLFLGAHRYVPTENTVYFFGRTAAYTSGGNRLHRFRIEEKTTEPIVPEQRPWGGDWEFESALQMDDDYFYWVEGWDPDGGTTLNSAEFIVRYPRSP